MSFDSLNRITAVVLAGGKSSRFGGRDKAFLKIDDMPMIELVTGRLKKIFNGKIIVVTHSPEKYSSYRDFTIVEDIYREAGPLGGIHAAMTHANTGYIFVVSCDMPYLDKDIIRQQLNIFSSLTDADALIPRITSNIEPLHAIYRTAMAEDLAGFLAATSNYSIRAFLENKNVAYFDLPGTLPERKAFSNINRPDDLIDHIDI